jgi:16S rRNA (guanine527-N7)-methyltransferase
MTDDSLQAALDRHAVVVPDESVPLLQQYAHLLWQWNEKMNLTRHTDWDRFVARDVVDALQIAPLLAVPGPHLDVGTGGGMPGILVQILRPELKVELLDQTEKKVIALQSMIANLGLKMLAHRDRVQDHLKRHGGYDTLMVRAVAPMPKLLKWLAESWPKFNRLLVIKGPAWKDECAEAGRQGATRRLDIQCVHTYPLAGTESESVILEVMPRGRRMQAPPIKKSSGE